MIEALPTHWNGIEYRSRLEARWAIFFDRIGVKHQYEAEGFWLPSGKYLPDFWLPETNGGCWIEVKGQSPTDREELLCAELAEGTGQQVFLAYGNIEVPDWGLESMMTFFPCGGRDFCHWWCRCPRCKKHGIQFEGRFYRISCCKSKREFGSEHTHDHPELVEAYEVARCYRFWSPL